MSNEVFDCHSFKNEDEWKKNRIHGIGGSDASSFIGMNKYKSNRDLWKEKKGIIQNEYSNEATEYGKEAEAPIRYLFQLKHPELEMQYMNDCQLQSKVKPYRTYSPDGLIYEASTGKKGIYEGKTMLIQNGQMLREWKDEEGERIPNNYFIQTLHGLLVTDFDFVFVCAELRYAWKKDATIIERYFTKEEVLESLEWLDEKEDDAWNYYEHDIEPPLLLNI